MRRPRYSVGNLGTTDRKVRDIEQNKNLVNWGTVEIAACDGHRLRTHRENSRHSSPSLSIMMCLSSYPSSTCSQPCGVDADPLAAFALGVSFDLADQRQPALHVEAAAGRDDADLADFGLIRMAAAADSTMRIGGARQHQLQFRDAFLFIAQLIQIRMFRINRVI